MKKHTYQAPQVDIVSFPIASRMLTGSNNDYNASLGSMGNGSTQDNENLGNDW